MNNTEVITRLRELKNQANDALDTVRELEANGDRYKDAEVTKLLAQVTEAFAGDDVVSKWDGTKAPPPADE